MMMAFYWLLMAFSGVAGIILAVAFISAIDRMKRAEERVYYTDKPESDKLGEKLVQTEMTCWRPSAADWRAIYEERRTRGR